MHDSVLIYTPSELAVSDCSIRILYYLVTVLLGYLDLFNATAVTQRLIKQILHLLCYNNAQCYFQSAKL